VRISRGILTWANHCDATRIVSSGTSVVTFGNTIVPFGEERPRLW
jgi:hypothetical protein